MTPSTDQLCLSREPVAKAEMLIRGTTREVFEAFVDPDITTKFWFTKSSGRLEPGATVRWDWGMLGVSGDVTVEAIEQDRRIVVEWSSAHGPTTAEWHFDDRANGTTFVRITNDGFGGDADQRVAQAIDSTEGFTIVLANLKAYLEHGVTLNLVADKFPDGVGQ